MKTVLNIVVFLFFAGNVIANATETILYTEVDYSKQLIPGVSDSGYLNKEENSFYMSGVAIGTGYTLFVEAGKSYLFTITISDPHGQQALLGASAILFTGGELHGDENDYNGDKIMAIGGVVNWGHTSEQTITEAYIPDVSESIRILVYDWKADEVNYSIQVDEITNILQCTDVDYSESLKLNTPRFGTMSQQSNFIKCLSDGGKFGIGYSFYAEEGKTYKLTFDVYVPATEYYRVSINLFDENFSYLESGYDDGSTTQLAAIAFYTADTSGDVNALLGADFSTDMIYSVVLEESISENPLRYTFEQLLNNPKAEITYSNSLSYTDNGNFDSTSSQVWGKKGVFFTSNQLYYADAYKIKMSAEDRLSIHYKHISDSHLYIYNVDGISEVEEQAGIGSVFIDFTAPQDGDYYIVATTNGGNVGSLGPYYLSLWNTDQEPDNNYDASFGVATYSQLFDNPIETIPYDDNLMFSTGGAFGKGSSYLVNIQEGLWLYEHFYVNVFKIHLPANAVINIQELFKTPHLYVYQNGYLVTNNYGYLAFAAQEEDDYFIVATSEYPWNSRNGTGNYQLSVWNQSIESISSDKSSITVDPDASEEEIKLQLNALNLFGTISGTKQSPKTSGSNKRSEIAIQNSPFDWTIRGNKATFAPNSSIYSNTELSTTVTINHSTSIFPVQNESEKTIKAHTSGNILSISGITSGMCIKIYSPSGNLLVNTKAIHDIEKISLNQPGIYIVRVENWVAKIIIGN